MHLKWSDHKRSGLITGVNASQQTWSLAQTTSGGGLLLLTVWTQTHADSARFIMSQNILTFHAANICAAGHEIKMSWTEGQKSTNGIQCPLFIWNPVSRVRQWHSEGKWGKASVVGLIPSLTQRLSSLSITSSAQTHPTPPSAPGQTENTSHKEEKKKTKPWNTDSPVLQLFVMTAWWGAPRCAESIYRSTAGCQSESNLALSCNSEL